MKKDNTMDANNGQELVAAYYAAHIGELRAFFMVRLADSALSEDMAQDVFVRLLRYREMITGQTLPSLVYTVARRLLADHYRHRMAVKRYRSTYKASLIDDISPQNVCYANELHAILERSIMRLPAPCREVYRLHVYDGFKVCRIVEETRLNYKVVERRLGVARREVRGSMRLAM